MMYNKDHYCPFCWENEKILRMVYLSPGDKTYLMCDIHGYVCEADRAKNSYIEINGPVNEASSLIGEAKIGESVIK